VTSCGIERLKETNQIGFQRPPKLPAAPPGEMHWPALPLVSLVLVHRNPLLDALSVDFARRTFRENTTVNFI
jgi:hypothetical protein